jgi:hypothetical protein
MQAIYDAISGGRSRHARAGQCQNIRIKPGVIAAEVSLEIFTRDLCHLHHEFGNRQQIARIRLLDPIKLWFEVQNAIRHSALPSHLPSKG